MRGILILVMSLVVASPAIAQNTRSISSLGHMALVHDDDALVFAVENRGVLAAHITGNVGAWTEFRGPGGLPLDPMTGVVRAEAPTGERVLAVAATQPGSPAQIWERTIDHAGVPGCWTALDRPIDARDLLGSAPSIAAATSRSPAGITVAVRTNEMGGNHVWLGFYRPPTVCPGTGSVRVRWLDVTLRDPSCRGLGVCQSFAADNSDVAIGTGGPTGTDIFLVTPRGTLRRYNVGTDQWSDVGLGGSPFVIGTGFPPSPVHWEVSGGGLAVAVLQSSTPQLRVVVGAHSPETNADSLFIANSTDGVTWGWTRMITEDASFRVATPLRSSVSTGTRPVSGIGAEQVVYANEYLGGVLFACLVPQLSRPVVGPFVDSFCEFAGEVFPAPVPGEMPHPRDMAPILGIRPAIGPGRDVLGPAVVGEMFADPSWLIAHGCASSAPCALDAPSAYRAFPAGDIAGTGYLYELETLEPAPTNPPVALPAEAIWYNLLAPHASVVNLPGGSQEFDGGEFFGTVALMDTRGTLWRTPDDGNTWPSTSTGSQTFNVSAAIGAGGRQTTFCTDTNLGYDGAGNLYVTTLASTALRGNPGLCGVSMPGDNIDSILITRIPAGSPLGSPSAPLVIPPTLGVTADRPWVAVRRDRPDFLFVTWAEGNGHGRMGADPRVAASDRGDGSRSLKRELA